MDIRQLDIYVEYLKRRHNVEVIHAKGTFKGKLMLFTNMGWVTQEKYNQVNLKKVA